MNWKSIFFKQSPRKEDEAKELEANEVKPKKRGRPKKYKRIILKHVKEAVERGVTKRDKTFMSKQMAKRSKAITQGNTQKMPRSKYNEIDERDALKKFKEKFEADKYKQSLKELKEIEIL